MHIKDLFYACFLKSRFPCVSLHARLAVCQLAAFKVDQFFKDFTLKVIYFLNDWSQKHYTVNCTRLYVLVSCLFLYIHRYSHYTHISKAQNKRYTFNLYATLIHLLAWLKITFKQKNFLQLCNFEKEKIISTILSEAKIWNKQSKITCLPTKTILEEVTITLPREITSRNNNTRHPKQILLLYLKPILQGGLVGWTPPTSPPQVPLEALRIMRYY